MGEFGRRGVGSCDGFLGGGLIGLEAVFAEGVVDPVVPAVAGDDDVGCGFGEGAVEAFVDVGAGEGVVGFGEAGAGFAGEADGEQFGEGGDTLGAEVGFEVSDEASGVGVGIAEEEDPFGIQGEGVFGGGERAEEDEGAEEDREGAAEHGGAF